MPLGAGRVLPGRPTARSRPTAMYPEVSEAIDSILETFEDAWQREPAPPLEKHLPPPGHPGRRQALAALACIDLERRLKARMGGGVEDYLARFPELSDDPEALTQLVLLECELRRRAGLGCAADELFRRFPQLAERLQDRLPTVGPRDETGGGGGPPEAGLDLRGYELL